MSHGAWGQLAWPQSRDKGGEGSRQDLIRPALHRGMSWVHSVLKEGIDLWKSRTLTRGFPVLKDSPVNARGTRELSLIPGSGRSPGEGNGNPLQYSCLENPMDRSLAGYSPWGCKESTELCEWAGT